ncbi:MULTISPECIES: helix-turn-helix transcriptional regulator [Staphylococcus]|uniref:Transcriptional regulator n=1 Tax=Staphylococcus warneri TaxID=1292 RepID=A0A2T4PYF6_STAWA|nr:MULTISPECIES: helix-turn-helix transcriptional regulator [Staphylococcus]MBE9428378.1 helix-turn-helix transcriptional regulator [Staphylococcus epidermidis]MBY6178696.1 helix-turn-helix transcriptional regulator [Staphylococcaceae bacterium DP2N0-1]MCI2788068.1 helix-turn-helix transcriptional regulator [Staphylococcus warneri]MDK4213327.1 helix-turn-helix transcriptional regulator [Staphylococcus warneri]MDU9350907.1 helix-turn-helix transcriptional regulator [Staphylococcus warneri]
MELNQRQEQIIEIVKQHGPITGEHIADQLNLTRATLRPDLAILTMSGFLEARPRVGYYYSGKSKNKIIHEQLRQYVVKDYMSQPVVVKEDMSVYDAICTIFLEDAGTLFITNKDNDFIGVCSRKDLLRASMIGNDIHTMPISVNMTRMPNLTYLEESELIIYAANQMIDKEIDAIPIVRLKDNQKFEVVGRISKTTITKLFVSLFKE